MKARVLLSLFGHSPTRLAPLPTSIQFHEIFETDLSVVTTPNFFHKILRVLSSVRHFFSVARDTPLNFFHKILRVLSSVRHFFSVARHTPLTFFHKILRVLSSVRHFSPVARHTIIVC